MFTSLFIAPIWFWSSVLLGAVLIPILIHLINLWRYRRVKWAAMDFLLKSFRKKQKRVRLTQLILILNRIALLLLAVIFFGQVRCNQGDSSSLSQGMVHLMIVDDSASMGERSYLPNTSASNDATVNSSSGSPSSALQRARIAVSSLANELAEQPGQKLFILTTSMSVQLDEMKPVDCDSNIGTYINNVLSAPPSDLATSPWNWLASNLDSLPDADRLYVFSDFRAKDGQQPDVNDSISSAKEKYADVKLVQCLNPTKSSENLSIVAIQPEHSLVAAGVPFYLQLEVRNHGSQTARNTKVDLRKSPAVTGDRLDHSEEAGVLIPEILPGKSVQVQIPMLIHQPGQTILEAGLPGDRLLADNVLHQSFDVQAKNQVLLIADSDDPSARYLNWLFEPESESITLANSGFKTETRRPLFFKNNKVDLSSYSVVFLLSSDLRDTPLNDELRKYVKDGGLLFVVPGEFADLDQINSDLFNGGTGLLGFQIDSTVELPSRPSSIRSDIQVLDPELRKVFAGDSQKLLESVQFFKKFVPPREPRWTKWKNLDPPVEVLATIRGRAETPLISRSTFGKGQVICVLSPFDDRWNNWVTNPTFLVLVYHLVYTSSKFKPDQQIAGQVNPFEWMENSTASSARRTGLGLSFLQSVDFQTWDSAEEIDIVDSSHWKIPMRGIYRISGGERSRWVTARVDPKESDLAITDNNTLVEWSGLAQSDMKTWDNLTASFDRGKTFGLGYWWVALILLLVAEQWLAWLLGFHQQKRNAVAIETGSVQQRRRHG